LTYISSFCERAQLYLIGLSLIKVTARDAEERNEWELRLASASKLSVPSLRRAAVPFQARPLERDMKAIPSVQFSVAHDFPSFPKGRLRMREAPRSSSRHERCILSKKQKERAQALAAEFRPRTGTGGLADGVPRFQQTCKDVSSAKRATACSPTTTFYDRAGQF
jgi:hypothetical protein